MSETPTCRACNILAVRANAGVARSIPYFYCRGCKNEVDDYGWTVISRPSYRDQGGLLFNSQGLSPAQQEEAPIYMYDQFLKRNRMVYPNDPGYIPNGSGSTPKPEPEEEELLTLEEDDDSDAWYFNLYP